MNQQMKLDLIYAPFTPHLFQRTRRAIAKAADFRPWTQLELKLILRKLAKGAIAFVINTPLGRLIVPTLPALLKLAIRPFARFLAVA